MVKEKLRFYAFEFKHEATGQTFFPADKSFEALSQARNEYIAYAKKNPGKGFYTKIGDIEVFTSLEDYKKEKARRTT